MSASDKIHVYFVEPYKGEYIDDDMDAINTSPFGILTWRREGQLVSADMQIVFSFDAEDATAGRSDTFIEQLMSFNEGSMAREFAMRVSAQFYQSIRQTIAQDGDDWGYFHSLRHHDLLEYNKKEMARMERGKLADWERALLDS